MALHKDPASMLLESLDEYYFAANFCVSHRKVSSQWTPFDTGGCLGFPGALLLFCIVDAIGSYYRGDKGFKVNVDNKARSIASDGYQHFFILNSDYFKQNLSEKFIKVLYNKFRSLLIHNAALGAEAMMVPGGSAQISQNPPFTETNRKGKGKYIVSLVEFLKLCNDAIIMFKQDIPVVVPKSRQGRKFH